MRSAPMRCSYAAIPTRAPRTQPAEPSFLYTESRLVMLSASRCGAHKPTRRARRPPDHAFSPFSFPPLETPLPESPFSSGLHQRGQTAGGTRTAAFLENGAKPRNRRGFLQRRFRPPPYGWPPPPPPLHQPRCARPQSRGQRVGRAETGCGRSGPRTVSALRGRRKAATGSPPKSCAAGFASRPATRRACSPSACGDLHRRVEAQSCSSPPGAPTVRLPPHNPPPARALMEK